MTRLLRFPERRKLNLQTVIELACIRPDLVAKHFDLLGRLPQDHGYSNQAAMYYLLGFIRAACEVDDIEARKVLLNGILVNQRADGENLFDWLGLDRVHGWAKNAQT